MSIYSGFVLKFLKWTTGVASVYVRNWNGAVARILCSMDEQFSFQEKHFELSVFWQIFSYLKYLTICTVCISLVVSLYFFFMIPRFLLCYWQCSFPNLKILRHLKREKIWPNSREKLHIVSVQPFCRSIKVNGSRYWTEKRFCWNKFVQQICTLARLCACVHPNLLSSFPSSPIPSTSQLCSWKLSANKVPGSVFGFSVNACSNRMDWKLYILNQKVFHWNTD